MKTMIRLMSKFADSSKDLAKALKSIQGESDLIYAESAKALAECGKDKMSEEMICMIKDFDCRSRTKYKIEDMAIYK